jgi:hypothetical protein
VNDLAANVLVFCKPQRQEVIEARVAISKGKRIVVDICDDWLKEYPWYMEMIRMADAVTCPTHEMANRIYARGTEPTIIPDPYEFEQAEPHCAGNRLLWFGHGTNIADLKAALPLLLSYPLRVVSNIPGTIPWSVPTLLDEMAHADIAVFPRYALYKSSNRAIEAIRRGCFVVAEPHPSLEGIPGIWVGNLKGGIEWASRNQGEANRMTGEAQNFASKYHSPSRIGSAWKTICEAVSDCISVAGTSVGKAG